MMPVFGVINKQSMSLYENDNVNSLITSYPLQEVYLSTIDPHSSSVLAKQEQIKCMEVLQAGQVMDILCLDSDKAR